jgi:hypothetical protein
MTRAGMGPRPFPWDSREGTEQEPILRLLFCSVPSLMGTDGTLFLAVPVFPVFPSFDRVKR